MHPSLTATVTHSAKPSHKDRLHLVAAANGALFEAVPPVVRDVATALGKARKFTARCGETLVLSQEDTQWVFVGMGKAAQLTRPDFAQALAAGFSEARRAGVRKASLHLPETLPWSAANAARDATTALLMASYLFRTYKTQGTEPEPLTVELVSESKESLKAAVKEGQTVAEAVALTRDLINQPAAVAHPRYLLEQAERVAKGVGARYHDIVGEALLRKGYEAVHAVGQASEWPPALAVLEFGKPGPKRPTVALVGKGITFDTGGLDLKPSSGMALMKKDMGGAAIVLGAFQAIAALDLPVHLVAVLGIAENAVSARSYRPGDIVKTKAGLTIEITNTDAEGRVVLADALALARTYQPDVMIDFATLTGACRTALGKDLMGLFCDDDALRETLVASATDTGDHAWPLPLWQGYRKKLDSPIADLINAPADGFGGAITAALFLKEFAGDVAWAHFDCYAWSEGETPLFPKGGSGVGVRLLVDAIPRLIAAHASRAQKSRTEAGHDQKG
jgi:leucyl aminopeptidase